MSLDFIGNPNVMERLAKWFNSKENGLYTLDYGLQRHQEIAKQFVICIENFTVDQHLIVNTYMEDL